MKKTDIGAVLKESRKRCSMTVPEVSFALNEKYHLKVAEKTIYGWESNQAHPTSDMFLILCELYDIHDILDTFGKDNDNFHISLEERRIIESYRRQPVAVQAAVRRILSGK